MERNKDQPEKVNFQERQDEKAETTKQIQIKVKRRDEIYSHIRKKFLNTTPEEWVRQNYAVILVNKYGYDIEQMSEEYPIPGSDLKADIVVWSKGKGKAFIVVECKEDESPVSGKDFEQGRKYALLTKAEYLIISKNGQIGVWRIRIPEVFEEIKYIPHAKFPDRLLPVIPVNEKLTSFVPKDWVRESRKIYDFHTQKVKEKGKTKQGRSGGWTIKQTATELNLSDGTVSQSVQLAKAMEKYPDLQNYSSKQDAWREYQKKEGKNQVEYEEL